MISSVPRENRAFGNSAAQFFLNLFGFLPAPFVYGFVCKMTGGRSSLWGMAALMSWSLFGLINIFLAFMSDRQKREEIISKKADLFVPILEGEKLSSISESSESHQEKIKNIIEKAKPLNGLNEENKPALRKKSSLLQVSYINSIMRPISIPKVKFKSNRKNSKVNCSYEAVKEKVDIRLTHSQMFINDGNKNENPNNRLRFKSTSVNYESELYEKKDSYTNKQ